MSYLKGPLKRDDIAQLMQQQKALLAAKNVKSTSKPEKTVLNDGFENYSSLDSSIPQRFMIDLTQSGKFTPSLMAESTLHFFNQTRGIDEEENICIALDIAPDDTHYDWDNAQQSSDHCFSSLPVNPPSEARYAEVAEFICSDKKLRKATTTLKQWLYHEHKLTLFRCKSPKLESEPYESLSDFKVRLSDLLNDKKEQAIETLQERYAKKEKVLTDRLSRALEKLDKEKADTNNSFLRVGITVLGALFGKSRASIGTAGTRVLKERGDVSRQQQRVEKIHDDIQELEEELEDKIDNLADEFDIDAIEIEEFAIKPRKTDIQIDNIAVVWKPV
jgi:Skp family chaperone for outer membrane proteins